MRICWSLGLTCTCIGLVAFSVRAAEDDTKKVLFNEDGERCAYRSMSTDGSAGRAARTCASRPRKSAQAYCPRSFRVNRNERL